MRRLALAPTLVCAFLSPQAAFGIGLGDIELQSALNQPLDAEIPLRGVSAGEGDDVVVALASEEAFRQVGLQRPFSLTHLQFSVQERDGSHYIQISSREPISEPFLSFLIEVDAREGNLLREYTVLLDPPVFASPGPDEAAGAEDRGASAAESPERAAVSDTDGHQATMRGRIESADTNADTAGNAGEAAASGPDGMAPAELAAGAESPVPETPKSTDVAAGDDAGTSSGERIAATDEGEFGDTPLFLQVAREEEQAERQLAERARAAVEEATAAGASSTAVDAEVSEPARPEEYGAVERGETLWGIADQLREGDVSVQQMMVALLRYNPEAFEDDNVNRLKEGYVLSVPDAEAVRSIAAQQAIASIREQNGLWREWRDGLESGGATQLASMQDAPVDGAADAGGDSDSTAADSGGDSRLDIVGADEGGATSDESASATAGTAADASEELAMAREELASVRAEREELADRVAQLEGTVDKMEQLVTVREEQLARLQQQLEELQQDNGSTTEARVAEAGNGVDDAGADDGEAAAAAGPGGGDASDGGGGGGGGPGDSVGAGEGNASAAGDARADAQPSSDVDEAGQDTGARTSASDEPQTVTPTTPPQRSWLDTVFGFFAGVGALVSGTLAGVASGGLSPAVLAAAAFLVLALLLLVVRRRRAAHAQAEEEALATPTAITGGVDVEPVEAAAAGDADDDVDIGDDAVATLMDDEVDLSTLDLDVDTDPQAAADETIAEADTYLAYGLHQQAEDLLRLALEESPERHDYHEKLLEALYAAGKSDAFASAADNFRNQLNDAEAPAWQRVRAMGREIAPQHALFSGAAAAGTGLAAGPTDDDDVELDLDLGAGLDGGEAGGDPFTQALLAEAEDADTVESVESAGPVAVAGAGAPTADADADLEFDLSDFDEPAAPAPGASAPSNGAQVDPGLEFDISDLGLGGGGAAAPAEPSDSDEADGGIDTGLDFDLGELGDVGELDAPESPEAEPAPQPSAPPVAPAEADGAEADLAIDLDDTLGLGEGTDGDEDAGLALGGAFDLGDGADGTAVDGLDLDDLDSTAPVSPEGGAGEDPLADVAAPGAGDELEVAGADEAPVVDFDFSSLEQELDQAGAASDGDRGDDDPMGEDLATMLDLAKAYIDMGDAESAANALEEVIAGGNDQQRAEAQSLLETVQ